MLAYLAVIFIVISNYPKKGKKNKRKRVKQSEKLEKNSLYRIIPYTFAIIIMLCRLTASFIANSMSISFTWTTSFEDDILCLGIWRARSIPCKAADVPSLCRQFKCDSPKAKVFLPNGKLFICLTFLTGVFALSRLRMTAYCELWSRRCLEY